MANVSFLYLASRSPRRRELLTQAGIPFRLVDIEIDESVLENERAADYVERLARSKAEAGWAKLQDTGGAAAPVLAADTTVALGGKLLGKPENEDDAVESLMHLSGQTHDVLTGIALCGDLGDGLDVETQVVTTRVRFSHFSIEDARRYVATGEPMDKAGSYGIQGFGGTLVESIDGSYSNVVGLPLKETVELAGLFGVPYWQKLSGDQTV
ncbi:Maf family nucleotide pyrophosphatase [Sansalvadorimonas sp. 2012CJ34-2]|uniref:dTTP/UTP pyrophosphatase n=1 Tax=Parendozoicomonas callyspongiae TaxID=2942213 RepID=A0ABT0PCF8_9GAMM|nr:nucleoside triphosphate pyrophosphatase [Sansalvadorimonas sp. 2012CJ34-2]MCL6268906.1 Maf family nucleotide pyrophosphatase [Sansalvadorimonas sp. 2012CJ34-2]